MNCECCGQTLPEEKEIAKILLDSGLYTEVDIKKNTWSSGASLWHDYSIEFKRTKLDGRDVFNPTIARKLYDIGFIITCANYDGNYMWIGKI